MAAKTKAVLNDAGTLCDQRSEDVDTLTVVLRIFSSSSLRLMEINSPGLLFRRLAGHYADRRKLWDEIFGE